MADDQPLSPLDDAFVSSLIRRVGVDEHLISASARRHWKDVLAQFPVAQHIAQRFSRGEWTGNELWFLDPGIQEVFDGYDWTRYAGQEGPTGRQPIPDAPSTEVPDAPRSQLLQATQAGQTGRSTEQDIFSTQGANFQAQSVQRGRQTGPVGPSTQIPDTPRGQNTQTGQSNQTGPPTDQRTPAAQALVTPQSQNVQTGRRGTQDTPSTQIPNTSRGQNSQTGPQNIPIPTSIQIPDAPRGQDTPTGRPIYKSSTPTQTPATPRGQNFQTGRSTLQDIPPEQIPGIPRAQGQAQFGAGGLTPGPDVADDEGPPRVEKTAETQGNVSGQQHQGADNVRRDRTTGLAGMLRDMTTPRRQQSPSATRLPSPSYDDQLDLDRELERVMAQPGQGVPEPAAMHDGSVPPPMKPSQQDMERSHDWKGQRLPPIGVRLIHLMNLLCDEDVDRDISWKEHFEEAEEYLLYIKNERFERIGPETREMVNRLLEMVAAHKIFEKYHYGTFSSTKIITPDLVNKPAPRLNYDHDNPIVLRGKGRPGAAKWNDIMPGDFPDQPRRQDRVNNMWLTEAEKKAGLTDERRAEYQVALARAEDVWWELEADEAPPADNLSVVENKMYEDIIAADFGRGLDGWVNIEPPAARAGPDGPVTRWCAGPTMLGDDAGSYARERGARRAGLQGALRRFHNMENQLACTPWRRLVLAPTAEELRLARRDAGEGDGRKWPLRALEPRKMRRTEGKDDPQGFTVAMAQFWRDQTVYLRQAREAVVADDGGRGPHAPLGAAPHPQWVTPPRSIWGPYVWRGVDPDTENHQDMLKQMRAVKKLFDRELRVAPRQLLTYMNELYEKGYSNQGWNQNSVVFQDPRTKADVVVNFHPRRDFTRGNLTDLDKMELYWIRFILNNSITTQMTQQIEPRTSLYMVFAERLSRIFNDISDPLFPSNETKVTVEDLLEYMHKKTDGPVKTVKFYAHDAQRWLERLAAQGRCRYEDDWRCYGWVQRPVPDCHPEQLVNWQIPERDQDTAPDVYPEDMVFAPRLKDLRAWDDVINGGEPPNPLSENVANYFHCLAYRWGRYMHKLENPDNGLEKAWKTKAAASHQNMQFVIDAIDQEYRDQVGWNKDNSWDANPLVSLVKRTLPDKKKDASVSPGASIQIIRDHIINEAMRNDTMLWPARNANSYTDDGDEKVRPPLWDWAKAEVRGPARRFFDVNRWPLQMQTKDGQRRIRGDRDLSVQQIWNPVTEDPTPWTLYRPKARPYVDEKVKYRSGHRIYPIGDTPRQKKVVEDQMYAKLGRAMGLPDNDQRRPGLFSTLSSFFRRGGHDDDDHDYVRPGSRLPRVKPKDIPKSYDPRAENENKRKAVDDARKGSAKAARLARVQLPDDA